MVLNRQAKLDMTTNMVESKEGEENEVCRTQKSIKREYAPTKEI